METLQAFGARLKSLRKERRVYQREMGDLLGVTLQHYQKIEHGDVNISVLTLCTLAGYFEVSTDYLLGLSEERKP
ncbi:MAG: helix-turn-helix transcriptional regulator [Oscillibacter sp.]|nr:helix-turn-helix transcriptional regulator [Oscillibacter sp.]